MYCTYVFMCMENESDTNKTAGIDLCQGIFVDFVPDVYLKFCKKTQTKQLLERKQKIYRFFGWQVPLAYKYEGGGKLHQQGQGDCSLRWIISRGMMRCSMFCGTSHHWGATHLIQRMVQGVTVSMASGIHCTTTVRPIYVGQWCPRKPIDVGQWGIGKRTLTVFWEIQPVVVSGSWQFCVSFKILFFSYFLWQSLSPINNWYISVLDTKSMIWRTSTFTLVVTCWGKPSFCCEKKEKFQDPGFDKQPTLIPNHIFLFLLFPKQN